MIILKQKDRGGHLSTRVKIDVKGRRNLICEATGAIAAICTAAQKSDPEVVPEALMELARKLIENQKISEEERRI